MKRLSPIPKHASYFHPDFFACDAIQKKIAAMIQIH
jgi:hypothetical protein